MDAGRPHPDPRNRDQTLIRVGLLHEEQREDAEGLRAAVPDLLAFEATK